MIRITATARIGGPVTTAAQPTDVGGRTSALVVIVLSTVVAFALGFKLFL